jgi:lysophospholipase L1-like esterase
VITNEQGRRRSKTRRWIARLVLVAFAVALALGLAEVAFSVLHLYRPQPRTYVGEFGNGESKNFAADPVLGWRMRADHRFTNQEAGRDVEYESDAEGFRIDFITSVDERRLVAVGDSFTYGAGVAAGESFPALLSVALGGWSLTNAAEPGYGLDQVWQSVVHVALPRKPDLVVAGIYPEDFERIVFAYRRFERMNKPTFRLDSGRLVPMTAGDRPGFVTSFLETHSRVFTAARRISFQAGLRYGVGEVWNLGAAMLDDMMRVCGDAHVPIVFVSIPPETLEPFPALAAHMTKRGALFVDPLDAMKKAPGPLYLEKNGHLNAAGHAVIANEVFAFLQAHPETVRSPLGWPRGESRR